jgi:phage terminase small subunit
MGINFEEIAAASTELVPEVLPAVRRKAGRPKGVKNGPNALTRGPDRSPLTIAQKKACHEFIACGSKAEAVRRAYGAERFEKPDKYGYELFKLPKVAAYLQKIQNKQLKKVDTNAEEVIERLRLIGLSKPTDFVSFDGGKVRLKPLEDIPQEALNSLHWEIKEVCDKDGNKHRLGFIKPLDSMKALELLGKNLGIFTEKVEVGVRPIFTFGDNGEGS